VPAAGVAGWLANEEPPVRVLTAVWLERGTCTDDLKQECPRGPNSCETTEVLMTVIIGVDPHKASHTAVAIGHDEGELGRTRVRATRKQVPQLLAWAQPLGARRWAIESAGGLGYLLAQQLVDAGEIVLDVPATLASRIRVLGTGRSDKNDPNDALSVAIAALRTPTLRKVRCADHAEVLRLLAKRNIDIGNHRTRVVCRLHSAVMELAPGGIAKELYASDAVELLDRIEPARRHVPVRGAQASTPHVIDAHHATDNPLERCGPQQPRGHPLTVGEGPRPGSLVVEDVGHHVERNDPSAALTMISHKSACVRCLPS
jgi:transposase